MTPSPLHPSISLSSALENDNTTSIISTSTESKSMPVWAVALIVLVTLLLVIGTTCVALLAHTRKKHEQELLKKKAIREGMTLRSPIGSLPISEKSAISTKQSSNKSRSPKSPSGTRTETIAKALVVGRTPVLPGKRLAVEVRSKKGRTPGAAELMKGKMFSASGTAVDQPNKRKVKKFFSFMNKSNRSTPEEKNQLKTVQKFVLGKRKRSSSETDTDEASVESSPSKIETIRSLYEKFRRKKKDKKGKEKHENRKPMSESGSPSTFSKLSGSHLSHDTPKTTGSTATYTSTATTSVQSSNDDSFERKKDIGASTMKNTK